MQEEQEKKEGTIQSTQKKDKKIKTRVILVLIFAVLVTIFAYVSYRGNYLETIEIGENFKEVFTEDLKIRYTIMGINFIFLFLFITFINRGIKKGLKVFFDEEKKEMPKLPSKSIAFIVSIISSIIITNIIKETVALYVNKAWFGMNDPVFGADLGFYIFDQPFIQMLIIYFIGLVIASAIYSTIYYIVVFNIYFDGINGQTLKKSKMFKQLITALMLL